MCKYSNDHDTWTNVGTTDSGFPHDRAAHGIQARLRGRPGYYRSIVNMPLSRCATAFPYPPADDQVVQSG